MPGSAADFIHRLKWVEYQVQQHLLRFDAVAIDGQHSVLECCLHQDATFRSFCTRAFQGAETTVAVNACAILVTEPMQIIGISSDRLCTFSEQ